jgi:SAM-dependent methyltransferase
MESTPDVAAEQAALWNGSSGQAWVEGQAQMDALFAPIVDVLVDAVRPGDRVLDVGCGAGATTRALAQTEARHVTGADISAPLIELARESDTSADFLVADAATHAFDAGAYDLLTSRFGVMFFADPTAAFANLRHATAPQGRLRFVTWRPPADNPFMSAGVRAARPLLPEDTFPKPDPQAPGQFAFADPERVTGLLTQAGWSDVTHTLLDITCVMPSAGFDDWLGRFGPIGRLLPSLDQDLRERVTRAVRAAYDPYLHGDEVRFTAGCWQLEATNPA